MDDSDGGDANVYEHAITCRNGRGDSVTINPCIAAYVWTSKGVLSAARASIDELRRCWPDVVIPHGGTADLLANLPRALAVLRSSLVDPRRPDLRYWVGVGIDGALDAWHAGKLTAAQVVARHVEVAKMLERESIEVAVLNGEGKWAIRAGSIRKRDDVLALASAVGHAYAEHAPAVVLALSSFGALGYHADVRALIEGLTPHCSIFTGQSYAARPGEVIKGVLPAILERDDRSQGATVKQGWMRDDSIADDDSPDDLDRMPTVQAHKSHPSDLCTVLVQRPHVLVWSVPTIAEGGRADDSGLEAIEAAIVIRREHGCGVEAIRSFQRAHRLAVDGRAGPETRRAALASK